MPTVSASPFPRLLRCDYMRQRKDFRMAIESGISLIGILFLLFILVMR